MSVAAGVYPVFNIQFKIGTAGRESTEEDMKVINEFNAERTKINIGINIRS